MASTQLSQNHRKLSEYPEWVLITGASGGIGREYAFLFAKEGKSLILSGRNIAKLSTTKHKISTSHPDISILIIPCDLASSPTSLGDNVSSFLTNPISYTNLLNPNDNFWCPKPTFDPSQPQKLGIFISNAGYGKFQSVASTSLDSIQHQIQTNVTAHVILTRSILPLFKSNFDSQQKDSHNRNGAIIFTSSILGLVPVPYGAIYGASKSFLQAFANALAVEVDKYSIDILNVEPSGTKTDFISVTGSSQNLLITTPPSDVAYFAKIALETRKTNTFVGWSDYLFFNSPVKRLMPRWMQARSVSLLMSMWCNKLGFEDE